MKKSEATKLVAMLLAAYPSQAAKMSEAQAEQTAAVFEQFLEPHSAASGARAVRECIAECRFMPSVAELMSRLSANQHDAVDATLAWAEVLKMAGQYGRDRLDQVEWSSPFTAAAVAALGWREICNSDESDHGTLRAQFRRAYEAAEITAVRDGGVERLLARTGADRHATRLTGGRGQNELPRPRGAQPVGELLESRDLPEG